MNRHHDWDAIASSPEFRALMAGKKRFIVGAVVFFLVYYFLLPVLAGYVPDLMRTSVIGVVNVGYLFALSQFFMAWIVAYLYVRRSQAFDAQVDAIRAKYGVGGGQQSA